MELCGKENGGGNDSVGDILLIDDSAETGCVDGISIEMCDGSNIITIGSERQAIVLLGKVAVSAVFNFREGGTKADADHLRAWVTKNRPQVRVIDRWTLSPDCRAVRSRGHALYPWSACRSSLDRRERTGNALPDHSATPT